MQSYTLLHDERPKLRGHFRLNLVRSPSVTKHADHILYGRRDQQSYSKYVD